MEPYSPEFGRRWADADDERKEHIVSDSKVRIKVSIPVTIGGYTGQRDQWEERECDRVVEIDNDVVMLTANDMSRIMFDRDALEQALKMLKSTPVKPIYRNDGIIGARGGTDGTH